MTRANIDWKSLGFGYHKTAYNIRCYYRNGAWGEIEISSDEDVHIHMGSAALHYGQQAFEGLKAFDCPDGKIRLFRAEANAARMQDSARYLKMAEPSTKLFCDMVELAVKLNKAYIPPFESGGSLYIRPVLFGIGAQVGVKPADEYLLCVFVTPVGSYFGGGIRGIKTMIDYDHDRAAPHGTGHVKAGGNYAASLLSGVVGHDKGFDSVMYLDPATHTCIDECGAANFFGIRDGMYVTPNSHSVLPSITNKTLCQLAEDLGLKVERRDIKIEELAKFTEAGACGTAAVISPIASVYDAHTGKTVEYNWVGPWTQKLYDLYRGIQVGTAPDVHGWVKVVE